jgi:hypothetical protein
LMVEVEGFREESGNVLVLCWAGAGVGGGRGVGVRGGVVCAVV